MRVVAAKPLAFQLSGSTIPMLVPGALIVDRQAHVGAIHCTRAQSIQHLLNAYQTEHATSLAGDTSIRVALCRRLQCRHAVRSGTAISHRGAHASCSLHSYRQMD